MRRRLRFLDKEEFRCHMNYLARQCSGISFLNPECTIAEIESPSRACLTDAKAYLERQWYYAEYVPIKDMLGSFNLRVDVSDSDLIKDGNKYIVNRLPKYNHSRVCDAITYVERYCGINTMGHCFMSLDSNPSVRYVSLAFDSCMNAMLWLNT